MDKYIRSHQHGKPPFSTYVKNCNHYDFSKLNLALLVGMAILAIILIDRAW